MTAPCRSLPLVDGRPGGFTEYVIGRHASSGHVDVEGSDVAETISRMQAALDHFRMEALDQAA
ncbi:hypothetical protein [Streptomyces sp. YS-3]|uniref:hypothetical protein n=1 Tax=Streptomyces sp. YS-3 TaxID=3381352 RepID=UPI0038626143